MTNPTHQRGFSMLELIVVVVLIGVIAAFGIKYFVDAMEKARAITVEMTAWRFGQTAATLRAWQRIPLGVESHKHGVDDRGIRWVDVEGTQVFLNENGWPTNTDSSVIPRLGQQSQQGCTELIDAILTLPMDDIRSASKNVSDDFKVFAIDGVICRYQLAESREDAWFFDYSLETGRVSISVPKLRIEKIAEM